MAQTTDAPEEIWTSVGFRSDLAFAKLTEEMIDRLQHYGEEAVFEAGSPLFRHGDRKVDMFVVLDGEIEVSLPLADDECKVIATYHRSEFAGELNLLTTQATLVDARAISTSRVLRVRRDDFEKLMREEGDIANLITSATIWRRIGILGEPMAGVVLQGHSNDPRTTEIQRFLVRNSYPHRIVEVSSQEPSESTQATAPEVSTLPSVTLLNGRTLSQPTIAQLADELGITELPDPETIYDVAVVGAGPSGLAAAVYAASEGLRTIVIESIAPGGQAGTSSKIENYLGFPTGISGQRLASRAQLQALKFGVRFAISRQTVSAMQQDGIHKLTLAGDIPVRARAVVIASGAQYRTLSIEDYARFENCGIYYAATAMEAAFCRQKDIIVVGGGNSAGQAALFLSGIANHVHHIVRGESLASTMSQYLISRLESSSRVTLYCQSEIVALQGDKTLETVTWTNRKTGVTTTKPVSNVFVMIGAEPNSGWLFGTVRLDRKGFVLTGGADGFDATPYATSVPGMFAVGDIRAESVKRVASAVGEGSVVIRDVHRYLADHRNLFATEPGSPLAALRSANATIASKGKE